MDSMEIRIPEEFIEATIKDGRITDLELALIQLCGIYDIPVPIFKHTDCIEVYSTIANSPRYVLYDDKGGFAGGQYHFPDGNNSHLSIISLLSGDKTNPSIISFLHEFYHHLDVSKNGGIKWSGTFGMCNYRGTEFAEKFLAELKNKVRRRLGEEPLWQFMIMHVERVERR